MKKTFASLLCLTAILLMTCLPLTGYAETQDAQGRFLYLDIPYDTITPEGVDRILLDTFGDIQYDEYGKSRITDFGYNFYFDVNFNEDLVSANRIILGRPGNNWATSDVFQELFTSDTAQFVDMDAQLVERYGEPNFRYFGTLAQNYDLDNHTRFMFKNNVWDAAMMIEIGNKDKLLAAYSCWDNITLTLSVSRKEEETRGYYSRLTLEFFDELYPKESSASIIDYPPDSGN